MDKIQKKIYRCPFIRYDSYDEWMKHNPILRVDDIALVYNVPISIAHSTFSDNNIVIDDLTILHDKVMVKFGDGDHPFNELKFECAIFNSIYS